MEKAVDKVQNPGQQEEEQMSSRRRSAVYEKMRRDFARTASVDMAMRAIRIEEMEKRERWKRTYNMLCKIHERHQKEKEEAKKMAMTCVYGGECDGCMECQDRNRPEDYPEEEN